MSEGEWLAEQFEQHRGRLRAVAFHMLGSPSEAEDAVQEAWLRLSRSDAGAVSRELTRRRTSACCASDRWTRYNLLDLRLPEADSPHPPGRLTHLGFCARMCIDSSGPEIRLVSVDQPHPLLGRQLSGVSSPRRCRAEYICPV
jgi:Sigma-70 region 2